MKITKDILANIVGEELEALKSEGKITVSDLRKTIVKELINILGTSNGKSK